MKISGIIAEYNPFHNGHLHHIKASVDATNAEAIVCIMSGNFVQRGAPAVFDKWTRASHALKNGVDLVIELPLEFSMASAERFAYGGVYLLNALNADYISFGAESSEKEITEAFEKLKNINSTDLKSSLKSGVNFAVARQTVAETDVLESPNNILALEYLKAIEKTNSKMIPNFVKRCSSDYNSDNLNGTSASAKAIRNAVSKKREITDFVPENTHEAYDNFIEAESFFNLIKYAVMSKDVTEIEKVCEVREGLEHRIKEAVYESNSLDELIKNIKSKRYTYSSISRMLFNILFDVRKDNISDSPLYIRVLGANEKGFSVLKSIKETSQIPIITKAASAYEHKNILPQIEKDFLASDIYFSLKNHNKRRVDLTTPPIIF